MKVRCESWKKCDYICSHKGKHNKNKRCGQEYCGVEKCTCKPLPKKKEAKILTAWAFVWLGTPGNFPIAAADIKKSAAIRGREYLILNKTICGTLTKIRLPMPGGKK